MCDMSVRHAWFLRLIPDSLFTFQRAQQKIRNRRNYESGTDDTSPVSSDFSDRVPVSFGGDVTLRASGQGRSIIVLIAHSDCQAIP